MDKVLETIHNLRTIHGNFSERDISEDDLNTILNACVRAANASARQSYSIIVVNDKQVIKEQFAYKGNKALLFCVDYNRIINTANYLGKEFKQDGILSFITGSTDTILAAQTAAIAAMSIGIDSLFTNSIHRRDISSLYETFKLPQSNCFPLIALILGYAVTEPKYKKGRINGKGVIHYEQYQTLDSTDLSEIIAFYDNTDNHMGMIDDWREKGYSHYLDWFYSSWTVRRSLEKEKEIYSVLEQVKFINRDIIKETQTR